MSTPRWQRPGDGRVWVGEATLTRTPVGRGPYHLTGHWTEIGRDRVLLTLCGCAIAYEDAEQFMVAVAPKVARMFARPCRGCQRRVDMYIPIVHDDRPRTGGPDART